MIYSLEKIKALICNEGHPLNNNNRISSGYQNARVMQQLLDDLDIAQTGLRKIAEYGQDINGGIDNIVQATLKEIKTK